MAKPPVLPDDNKELSPNQGGGLFHVFVAALSLCQHVKSAILESRLALRVIPRPRDGS
jgi:hypothetical protein